MEIILPHLEPWQRIVYDAVEGSRHSGRLFVCKSKRQVGKSLMACVLLIKFVLERKCVSGVIEPTLSQSRRVFKQIQDMLEGTGLIVNANASLLTMTFRNGSEILFKSAEQRESLRGMTITGLLVIDEAAFIDDSVTELLFPTVDAHQAPILFISTPLFRNGKFYDLYMDGIAGVNLTQSFDWSKYDTSKFLSNQKLEMYRQSVSPQKFRTDYLGEFLDEGSYIFGDNIGKCIKPLSTNPAIYAGVDWSSGKDKDDTVITLLDAYGNVCLIDRFNDLEPTAQIEHIIELLNQYPTLKKVQVELNSIGSVYYDMLIKAFSKQGVIVGFNTTNDSKRTIIEKLIVAFENQRIGIPNDDMLLKELQHYAMEKTKNGYTYNGADNVHDDMVLSLAFAYDLLSSTSGTYSVRFR